MTDPYKILGVKPSDDDETIKQAYRNLVRKYHPDKYANTDLAEMANEKMKDINAAYEQIQQDRKVGTQSSSSNGFYGGFGGEDGQGNRYSGSGAYAAEFARIRAFINNGNLDDAQTLLRNMPESGRDAEWHFLMGCVLLRRGYWVDAQNHLDRACRLDPYNAEYRTVANRLRTQAAAGSTGGYQTNTSAGGCSECDICSSLLCADCCCECMGGDLVPCC